jgi:hypothetical protein
VHFCLFLVRGLANTRTDVFVTQLTVLMNWRLLAHVTVIKEFCVKFHWALDLCCCSKCFWHIVLFVQSCEKHFRRMNSILGITVCLGRVGRNGNFLFQFYPGK